MKNKSRKDQIEEVLENQNHILNAVKNLNERVLAIEQKIVDGKIEEIKDIIDSQTIIDELLVKNSNDIESMKKVKGDNDDAIKNLATKIEVLDEEIKKRTKELNQHNDKEKVEQIVDRKIVCKYYNRGYCRRKSWCWFLHPKDICRKYLKNGKCSDKDCPSRHPNICKYQKKGCNRGYTCAYLHSEVSMEVDNRDVITYEENLESNNHDAAAIVTDETMEDDYNAGYSESNIKKCAHCQSETIKNQCERYYCENCELKFKDESIFDFFKSNKFENYTCNTVHITAAGQKLDLYDC